MDFLLISIGSHGDIHPFVGIGRALMSRGHTVKLAANEAFASLIERAGIAFIPMGDRAIFEQMKHNPDVWHPIRGPGVVMQNIAQNLQPVYDIVARHATQQSVVVGSSLALGARVACEQLNIANATIHLAPICIRTRQMMPVLPGGFDANWLPGFMRNAFWEGADKWFIDPALKPALNQLRAEVGLAPISRIQENWWHAPQLTLGLWPGWFFPRQNDYPQQVQLGGFAFYDESDQVSLDASLVDWLGCGDKPIAFTPGSAMVFGERFFAAAVDACRRLNRRGILLTRHTNHLPGQLPDSVRHVPFAPFGKLLPHCAALVHHGGIGTTSQALRAGVPQLIMPMSHDQFDNAAICRRLGVADAVSVRRFTGWRVERKLSQLIKSPGVASACATIAAQCADTDSVSITCNLLEAITPPAVVK
jgi:rhamnosyltransferase subunit B